MIIKRTIFPQIRDHLSLPEITMIVGPRQVGKTTIITELADQLRSQGEQVLSFNLDIEDDFQLLASQSQLVERIKLQFGSKKGFVFIDEVQRKDNAGLFFKGIFDMNLPHKIILTGSGSVELKEKISESLAGRKQLFEVLPVSFLEFVDYKTEYIYSDRLPAFLQSHDPRLILFLNEYLQFGGYPRVIQAETLERKRLEMQEIYTSFIEKDIIKLLNIQKTDALNKLLTILASQIGSGINISELGLTLGLDQETVKKYVWYLEKTYILQKCTPFYSNVRSELSKTPIFYFTDLGMRNFALNRFSHNNLLTEGGHLFENFILNHLLDNYSTYAPVVNYWRTKDGSEVDFIFKIGAELVPIEVKYQKFTKPLFSRSMHAFIAKYSPPKFYVVNLQLNQVVQLEQTEGVFIDYAQFLSHSLVS